MHRARVAFHNSAYHRQVYAAYASLQAKRYQLGGEPEMAIAVGAYSGIRIVSTADDFISTSNVVHPRKYYAASRVRHEAPQRELALRR